MKFIKFIYSRQISQQFGVPLYITVFSSHRFAMNLNNHARYRVTAPAVLLQKSERKRERDVYLQSPSKLVP